MCVVGEMGMKGRVGEVVVGRRSSRTICLVRGELKTVGVVELEELRELGGKRSGEYDFRGVDVMGFWMEIEKYDGSRTEEGYDESGEDGEDD